VTARDVVESWRARSASGAWRDSPLASIAESAAARDDKTLVVTLPDSSAGGPLLLGRPELAVWRSVETSPWPAGTSRYRIDTPESHGASQGAVVVRGDSSDHEVIIALRSASEKDGRDLLDGGVDVLVTDDPSVLEYASTKPEFVSLPLPWERTYVLLVPSRARARLSSPADSARGTLWAQWSSFRAALARDAVGVEARGAEGPFWWEGAGACGVSIPVPPDSQATAQSPRRIVYERGDRAARDLAERLVALAAFGRGDFDPGAPLTSMVPEVFGAGASLTAAALTRTELGAALRRGDELAYIVALPGRALTPCQEVRSLAAAAPWLAPKSGAHVAAAELDLSRMLVPLVDTRSRVIVRRGVAGVAADWDGTLHLRGATHTPPGATP
jgi:hypothetical protein